MENNQPNGSHEKNHTDPGEPVPRIRGLRTPGGPLFRRRRDDDGDLYEWGVQINNYAAPYSDQFVIWAAREYNFPRNDLRYYLRKGYSPSDLLAGIELSRRSGYPLRAVMDYYRRGKDRNWINVSLHFGIGRSSADFRIILGQVPRIQSVLERILRAPSSGTGSASRLPPRLVLLRPDAPHRRPAPKPPRPVVRPPHPPRPQMPGNRPAVPSGTSGSAAAAFEHRPAAAPRIPSAEPKIHLRT